MVLLFREIVTFEPGMRADPCNCGGTAAPVAGGHTHAPCGCAEGEALGARALRDGVGETEGRIVGADAKKPATVKRLTPGPVKDVGHVPFAPASSVPKE
jgi:hypothetical protein